MNKSKDVDGSFSGRHFDRQDGRARSVAGAHRDHALGEAFPSKVVKRWNRLAMPAGRSWRLDETYVKIRGKWTYLYRGVDREGKTVGFRLSARRDVAAARAFFAKAIRTRGHAPGAITLDSCAASCRAAREMKTDGLLPKHTRGRSATYLNNLIEHDHRHIRSRANVMLGFKQFRNAAVTISGIELMHYIRKGMSDLTAAHLEDTPPPST